MSAAQIQVILSSPESFAGLIGQTLSQDNATRRTAEDLYAQLKRQRPDNCATGLLQLLRASADARVRATCAVFLRKFFKPATKETGWDDLSRATKTLVKRELLAGLAAEADRSAAKQTADAVVALGEMLLSEGGRGGGSRSKGKGKGGSKGGDGGWSELLGSLAGWLPRAAGVAAAAPPVTQEAALQAQACRALIGYLEGLDQSGEEAEGAEAAAPPAAGVPAPHREAARRLLLPALEALCGPLLAAVDSCAAGQGGSVAGGRALVPTPLQEFSMDVLCRLAVVLEPDEDEDDEEEEEDDDAADGGKDGEASEDSEDRDDSDVAYFGYGGTTYRCTATVLAAKAAATSALEELVVRVGPALGEQLGVVADALVPRLLEYSLEEVFVIARRAVPPLLRACLAAPGPAGGALLGRVWGTVVAVLAPEALPPHSPAAAAMLAAALGGQRPPPTSATRADMAEDDGSVDLEAEGSGADEEEEEEADEEDEEGGESAREARERLRKQVEACVAAFGRKYGDAVAGLAAQVLAAQRTEQRAAAVVAVGNGRVA
ncbi:hypothetical protein GPECTOR_80g169 [Gonium pectorale]|uniref:Importin N-terminal domain-containing protein n=1 Tax=Gonium pectorale TaxID=33097 RepID=A0A150G1Q0_GONPE|nr:hypothetical protein GPECTOR_80g169 [Gonium pectorale]|eukprot:KXZ43809.1 hypothetical protein GPECTOR_80g169 [Gonium pectorale]